MTYSEAHWQRVAELYREAPVFPEELTGGKTEHTVKVAKVQNRYPHVTQGTVAEWVAKCRARGLL